MINWLFQTTQTGATYLQAVVLSVMAIALIIAVVDSVIEFFKEI